MIKLFSKINLSFVFLLFRYRVPILFSSLDFDFTHKIFRFYFIKCIYVFKINKK